MRVFTYIFALIFLVSCSSGITPKEGDATVSKKSGKEIYQLHCIACHGEDGKKRMSGAADLSVSAMEDQLVRKIILKGSKKGMMPYEDLLKSEEEVDSLVNYVKTLRK